MARVGANGAGATGGGASSSCQHCSFWSSIDSITAATAGLHGEGGAMVLSVTAHAALQELGVLQGCAGTAARGASHSPQEADAALEKSSAVQQGSGRSPPGKGGKGLSAVQQGAGVQPGAGVLGGVGVLVVDDASVNLLVARRTLTRSGATVATAASGEEALRRAKHALGLGGSTHHVEPAEGTFAAQGVDTHVDVVLMDLQMPLMDG
ncbi:unnamed protein product [Closterium sp. Yama58-4]|nr:unnamed protein product [Closterium sp. Yama58-4]